MKKKTVILMISVILLAVFMPLNAFCADNFENEISAFPESYKVHLRELHKKYPNWKFECINTGLDWNAAVEGENYAPSAYSARSAISSSANNLLKDKSKNFYTVGADGKESFTQVDAGFVRPNKMAISYYMDPRNFLNESDIFQFEMLSFSSYIKVNDVDQILKGTFMYNTKVTYYDSEGKLNTNSFTYAQCIYDAGKENNVNPCFLASKIRNEIVIANGGPSGSVTGQYKGYEGYYNFFNIGAYSGSSPITNGLKYASTSGSYGRPWNTPKKSINGGAQYLAQSYIAKGQDTGYFQKYNVSPKAASAVYTHQYMTNITGAVSQAKSTYNSYAADGLLSLARTFLIPVFKNMPGEKSQMKDFAFFDSDGQKGVTNERVNVRKVPSLENSSVLTTVDKDTPVTVVLKCKNTSTSVSQQLNYPFWYQVKFSQGNQTVTGYILANYVTISSELKINTGSTFTLPVRSCGDEKPVLFTWDTSVVSVSADNTLKALKAGTAYVTAYTSFSGYEYIKVHVGNYPNSAYGVSSFTARVLSGGTSFSWNAVNGASGYELTVFNGNNILYAKTLPSSAVSANVSSLKSKEFSAKLRAYNQNGNSKLCGEFSYIEGSDLQLEQVSGMSCANISTSSYTLSWNKVSGANGYQLFKYKASSGKYELYKTLETNSCVLKSLSAGSYDKYKVRAYANTKYGTVYSPESAVFEGYTYSKTMNSPTASQVSGSSLTIKWTAVQGADVYYIYKFDTKKNSYVKCGETSQTSYSLSSLSSATSYKIRVEAVSESSDGAKRVSGHEACFSTLPGKVSGLKQTSSTGTKANISWNKVSGASSYMVYLSNSATDSYKLYLETTDTACAVTSLKCMSTNKVKVCAAVKNGNEKFKGEISGVLNIYTGPKKVTGLKTSKSTANSIKLKWSGISGANGYKIYSVNSETGESILLARTDKTSYTVKSLSSGNAYIFRIRAYRSVGSVNYNGNKSADLHTRTVPGKVNGLSSSEHTTNKYTLNWKKLINADGYIIYRYDSSSKSYQRFATSKNNSYSVNSLKSAKKNTYKVAGYIKENGKEYIGEMSASFKTATLPNKTSKVTVVRENSGKLKVSWESVERASGYRVYAYDEISEKWISLGYTSKDCYTVSASKLKSTYTKIKVRSYVKAGSKRYYSSGTAVKII